MTPPKISPALHAFLTDWLAWVERGAPDGEPYWRSHGLCVCSLCGPWGCDELSDEIGALFDVDSPFSSEREYDDRHKASTQHLNEARLSWVRRTILTAEIEG